jgi:hypothetical protein
VILSCGILVFVLLFNEFAPFPEKIRAFAAKPGFASLGDVADQSFFWLASFVIAGLLFESQNTGSQAFIFLWPLLLAILLESYRRKGPSAAFATIAVVALGVALPPAITIAQKTARAWIGAVNTATLENRHLKAMGAVGVRDIVSLRAERLHTHYVEYRATYEALATAGEFPSFLLHSDMDFQALWLQTVDGAISAIDSYETVHKVRFATIMTIDFTNPFPWLMDRHAPKYVAIGADPYRAVPPPDQRVYDAVSAVDLALYPTCPPTMARLKLLKLYEPALAVGHRRITLTPCFDAFVRDGLAAVP